MSSLKDPTAFFRGEWTDAIGSSNVASAKYEYDADRGTGNLFIRYHDGTNYQYLDVPIDVAQAWAGSPSLGRARWELLGDPRRPGGAKYGYIIR